MRKNIPTIVKRLGFVVFSFSILAGAPMSSYAASSVVPILQPTTIDKVEGKYYVPSTVDNIRWGHLPDRESKPILTVPTGSTVTFDTVSHEGILEDQGRNPVKYFGAYGVSEDQVLDDAKTIAASSLKHDFDKDGPHIVTGPVAVEGAEPGDVLKVEVLSLTPRVPYGVISNRHFKGALPGEFPENEGRKDGASTKHPELYNNVSKFTPVEEINGKLYGVLPTEKGEDVRFPLNPFLGTMGVASNVSEEPSSIPPTQAGGNLDNKYLGVGATLYLPIQVKGGLFFVSDPHFAQGNGEVALTAMEASLRGTFRLTLLKKGDPSIPQNGDLKEPFGETEDYWIPMGLNPDLDEAMKETVREAIAFLNDKLGMDRATALAYMSAATDYEVTQVVDKTKEIHALINKRHFIDNLNLSVSVDGKEIGSEIANDEFYVSLRDLTESLGGQIKWDQKNQSALLTIGDQQISVPIGQSIYQVNGKSIYQSGAAQIHNGSTYIPIKVAQDVIGAKVNWTTSGKTLNANITRDTKK